MSRAVAVPGRTSRPVLFVAGGAFAAAAPAASATPDAMPSMPQTAASPVAAAVTQGAARQTATTAAAAPTRGQTPMSFVDALEFLGVGLIVVLFTLSVLSLLLSIMGMVFRRIEAGAARAKAPGPARPATARLLDPDIPAVLAAAVAAMIDAPHRVLSITPSQESFSWSREGRREHYASHKLK